MKIFKTSFLLSVLFVSYANWAQTCFDKKNSLELNESQLLTYRDMTEHGFKARGHIEAVVVEQTENRQGHLHFIVDLDENLESTNDRLELIYNQQYGEIENVVAGQKIRACGDFIVDQYSPTKAVLHWLHLNPNKKKNKHEDGFLMIDGKAFGLLDR